jgi:hypothetical protein
MTHPGVLTHRSSAVLTALLAGLTFCATVHANSAPANNVAQGASSTGASQPFQGTTNCTVTFAGKSCEGSYSVPAGVRLDIDYLSFYCPTTHKPQMSTLLLTTKGAGVEASFAVTLPEYAGEYVAQVGQTVRFYADPGTTITFVAGLASGTFNYACVVSFAGRQVAD